MNHAAIILSDTELGARLKDAGLRSTGPRRAVLAVLARGDHWNASDVFDAVSKDLEGTSLQAVYGVLSALEEVGLARKIELPGHPAHYEYSHHDNHHHLVCTECGAIRDVPCVVGAAPCLSAEDDFGFAIRTAEVTYRGICGECQARQAHEALQAGQAREARQTAA